AAVAVRQAAARAAQRRPLHHRGGGDAAGAARTQARDRDRTAGELRTLARALSRSASGLGGWAPALICSPRTARSLDVSPMLRRRSGQSPHRAIVQRESCGSFDPFADAAAAAN